MASLRKIKINGHLYYQVRFFCRKKSPNEKNLYFPVSRYRKSDMISIQRELEFRYKAGLWDPWTQKIVDKTSEVAPLFHDVLDRFIKDRKSAYAKNTWRKINTQINNIKDLPETNVPLDTLSAETLKHYVNDETRTFETRKTRRGVIKTLEKWVLQRHPDTARPFTPEIVAPQADRRKARKTYITSEELQMLVDIIPDHERTIADIITLAFYTGMRISEITNMRIAWIQGDYIEIGDEAYRPKSDSSEATPIPITRMIQKILERRSKGRPKSDYLFLFRKSGNRENYNKIISSKFKSYAKIALPEKQDKLSFHKLRDSAAMYWLHERKMDVYQVRAMLRHSSVTMTEKYLHAKPDALLEWVRQDTG